MEEEHGCIGCTFESGINQLRRVQASRIALLTSEEDLGIWDCLIGSLFMMLADEGGII